MSTRENRGTFVHACLQQSAVTLRSIIFIVLLLILLGQSLFYFDIKLLDVTSVLYKTNPQHHVSVSKPNIDVTRKETVKNTTVRLGCRSYERGMQSCVYEGMICVNLKITRSSEASPIVHFVDDTGVYDTGSEVKHDDWCDIRYRSGDPFYYGVRQWPVQNDLFAPRGSCLEASWTSSRALFNDSVHSKIQWVDDLSLIHFDMANNDHNIHFSMDVIWLLDVMLWQNSVTDEISANGNFSRLFKKPGHILFPNSKAQFRIQTRRDVNRLLMSLILQLDPKKLYSGRNIDYHNRTFTNTVMKSYPSLEKVFIFLEDEKRKDHDFICTKRLVAGPKLADMGNPRVCEHIRRESWKLFDISPPEVKQDGYFSHEKPPKRVIVLNRHIDRRIINIEELSRALYNASLQYNFDLEVHSTSNIRTAEDHVRFFRRAGVLVTPHGGHVMGAIWMPRYSSVVEIYPAVYREFSVASLIHACRIWHFQVHLKMDEKLRKTYIEECGDDIDNYFKICARMKYMDMNVDVDEVVVKVIEGIRILGYNLNPDYDDKE